MLTKHELMMRICDLECVVDLLEDRIFECEQSLKKKKTRRKNETKK